MYKQNSTVMHNPTSVIFVDDNPSFLNSLPLSLEDDLPYVTESDPELALARLNSPQNSPPPINACFTYYDHLVSPTTGINNIEINVSKLYQHLYDATRFDRISVVVVDYNMPKMNGLEFCRRIKNPFIKKIVLTGIADESTAVEAFNEGIIDKFFTKGNKEFKAINNAIRQLQHKYFVDLAKPVNHMLLLNEQYIFQEPEFHEIFKDICKKHRIVEMYLLDENGSHLLIDNFGKAHWLFIHSIDDMQMFYELASENGAPSQVLSALKERTKMPCLPREKYFYNLESHEWEKCLYKTTPFKGKLQYYYSLINDEYFDLNKDEIFSFQSFTQKRYLS